ncbi:MAG TPA: chemotaxis protein CheD [Ramlibacter sp.]
MAVSIASRAPDDAPPGEPSPAGITRVIGIAEMAVSPDPSEVLVTYALGSCLGVAAHDPVAGVGGLIHLMLPDSTIDAARARDNPLTFVDTGVPRLFRALYGLGADKRRMVVKVAGGASATTEDADKFQIGKRNWQMLRKLFWRNGVLVHAHDVGGVQTSRTMSLHVGTGVVQLRIGGRLLPL